MVQMHKIIFTLVDIPRGTALRYILNIFAHLCFFLRSCIFWEPFSCFISIFDRCSWYFLEAYLIKGIFSKHLLFCWETFEVILSGFILGYAPLFLKAVSFYLMKLCIDVFYVTLTFPSKQFQSTYPSAGSIMQYFGPILSMLIFSRYFAWMSWYYFGFPLFCAFLGVLSPFCNMLFT